QPEIVVAPVEDQLVAREDREERPQIETRQRIHQQLAAWMAQLQQTKLLRVRVQTVRLGVEGDPPRMSQFLEGLGEPLGRVNHPPIKARLPRAKQSRP